MKKKLMAAAAAITVLMAVTGCGGKDIGKEAALEAALNDAGVVEEDTTRLKISEDRDDGQKIYEIQFDANGKEYDYEIAAADGRVLSADQETIQTASDQTGQTTDGQTAQSETSSQSSGNQDTTSNTGTGSNANVSVSLEEATAIALERVPGATEKDIVIKLDYDDGRYKYEGDIIHEQIEYEFEIDANTGTILEWSEERA